MQNMIVENCTVQYCTVQYSTVHTCYSQFEYGNAFPDLKYMEMICNMPMQNIIVENCTVQHSTVQYSAVQYSDAWCIASRCNTVRNKNVLTVPNTDRSK